jgi:hypothetical protein
VADQWLVDALRTIAMNDRTTYEHHEPRPRDGKSPKEAGGTIWTTPRQVALACLEKLGQETQSLYWPFTASGEIERGGRRA